MANIRAEYQAHTFTLVALICQQFLLVPVFLSFWGTDSYELWLVLVAVSSSLRLADLGLQYYLAANIRLLYHAEGATASRTRLREALGLYCQLGAFLAIVVIALLAAPWERVFGPRFCADTRLALAFLSLSTLAQFPRDVIAATYDVHHQHARRVHLVTGLIGAQASALALTVFFGGGIVAAAASYLVATLGCGLLLPVLDQRRFPDLKAGVTFPSLPRAAEVVRSSLGHLPFPASQIVLINGPILFLSALAPVGSVVIFTLARTLTGTIRMLNNLFSKPGGVELAREFANQRPLEVRASLTRSSLVLSSTAGVLGGAVAVVAAPFFGIWTNGVVEPGSWIVPVFVGAVVVGAPGLAAVTAFQFTNITAPLGRTLIAQLVVTFSVALASVTLLHATGMALGILAGDLVGSVIFSLAVSRYFGVDPWRFFLRSLGLAAACFLASSGIAWMVSVMITPRDLLGVAEWGAGWALCSSAVGACVYFGFRGTPPNSKAEKN